MRITSFEDLALASARFHEMRSRLNDLFYTVELTDHPIAGPSLRHYLLLAECPELLTSLALTESERQWNAYYWLARFAKEWEAAVGEDAGLEQKLCQLLELMDTFDPAEEVMAAVERDAVLRH